MICTREAGFVRGRKPFVYNEPTAESKFFLILSACRKSLAEFRRLAAK
jgi:hypothetical protein